MSFDRLKISQKQRVQMGQLCSVESCDCSNCPFNSYCEGPSDTCDAKFCSTRTRQPLGCYECRAICNRHPDKERVLQSIGGTPKYDHIKWEPFTADIPDVIFQINSPIYRRNLAGAVVNSKKLWYLDSNNWSPQKNLRRRYLLKKSTQVFLSFFTDDRWMDRFALDIRRTAQTIAQYNADYVFSMNFSCYDNYPRFDIITNMKRRMLSLDYMQEEGVKVIPCLGGIRKEDHDKMTQWCADNHVKYAAINLQTISTPTHNPAWPKKLDFYKEFREKNPDCELIIVGSTSPKRLKSVMQILGPVKLLDTQAFRRAEYYKDMDGKKYPKSTSVLDLFEVNRDQLTEMYNQTKLGVKDGQ